MSNVATQIEQAIELLRSASKSIALTGAGISTPSGIPDFRSPSSGLWQQVDPMEVASIAGFKRNPQAFYDWLHPLAKVSAESQPNAAHIALADLEISKHLSAVITQNIDGLHARAGSQTVYEVHGHSRELVCPTCAKTHPADPKMKQFIAERIVPRCDCDAVLKPNVVLFGELLPASVIQAAYDSAETCDVMLVVGSSLQVYPVADLPRVAVSQGAHMIIVNNEPTPYDALADVVIHADVVDVLPQFSAAFA